MKHLALALSFSISTLSFAEVGPENFTLLKIDATAPSAHLRLSTGTEMDFDDSPGGYLFNRLSLGVPLGEIISLSDSASLSFGLSYEATWLETDTVLGNLDLHDIRTSVTLLYNKPGSDFSGLVSVSPGLGTDFSSLNSDSISIDWGVVGIYKLTDYISLMGGVGRSHSTGDNDLFPAIGFQWHATDKIYVYFLGSSMVTTWQPSDDWLVRLSYWSAGGIWNVEENGAEYDVFLEGYRVGIGVERRLKDKLWLSLWGGFSLANELEIENEAGNKVFNDDADLGWFLGLGLRMAAW